MLEDFTGTVRVEAERRLSQISVQLIDIDLPDPVEANLHEADDYRLDISLAPRRSEMRVETRVRYLQHWAPDRFVSPGKIFLLPPHETMHLRSEAGKDRALVCHLSAAYLAELAGGDLRWEKPELEASLDIRNARLSHLMLNLAEEIAHPGFATNLVVEATALEIGVALLRYRLALRDVASGGLPSWRRRIVDERLEEDAAPTLSELAVLCGLSVRQLARAFRASQNISLGRYVAEHRFNKAKRRLAEGEGVKAVAYAMGFSSPATFCKAFRQRTGMTPGYYKQFTARRN